MKWLVGILLVILAGLQYRLWGGDGSFAQVAQLRANIVEREREIARLQERNRLLAVEVRELKTGLKVLEEKARTDMGLIKEGETFFMVIDDETNTAATP